MKKRLMKGLLITIIIMALFLYGCNGTKEVGEPAEATKEQEETAVSNTGTGDNEDDPQNPKTSSSETAKVNEKEETEKEGDKTSESKTETPKNTDETPSSQTKPTTTATTVKPSSTASQDSTYTKPSYTKPTTSSSGSTKPSGSSNGSNSGGSSASSTSSSSSSSGASSSASSGGSSSSSSGTTGGGTTNGGSSSSSGSSSGGSTTTTPQHQHNWVLTTVHHEEVGHYETREQIVNELVPIYDDVYYVECTGCGATFSNSDGWSAHLHSFPDEEMDNHSGWRGLHDRTFIGYEESSYTEYIDVYVIDSYAWDDTFYTCSCGARRNP